MSGSPAASRPRCPASHNGRRFQARARLGGRSGFNLADPLGNGYQRRGVSVD